MPETRPDRATEADTAERRELYGEVALLGSLGLTVAGAVIGFFFAGLAVSRWIGGGLAPVLLGVALGVALSFWRVYRVLTRHLNRPGSASGSDTPR
jgi:hypothetical protein